MYTVYIIQNEADRLYIGQTKDLIDRLERHNQGRSSFTRGKGPWKLVYSEEYPTRSEAVKRERQLKKWRRELLMALMNKQG